MERLARAGPTLLDATGTLIARCAPVGATSFSCVGPSVVPKQTFSH